MAKYRLLIFLSGVGKGLEKLRLDSGLKIKAISNYRAQKLYAELEEKDIETAATELFINFNVINEKTKQSYYITKLFSSKDSAPLMKFGKINKEIILKYIPSLLTKLRLFKEGPIGYQKYYFYNENDRRQKCMSFFNHFSRMYSEKYELIDKKEIVNCNKFIKEVSIPDKKYIQIAIDNFNQSYESRTDEISFLNLMISIESLFSKSHQETSFKLKRNCAIFIGTSKKKSKEIYEDMDRLYKIRSKIIHGNKYKLELIDVFILREYVRKSIIRFIQINTPQEDILKKLNFLGFGQYKELGK